ncbi:MAG: ArsR family transcriptional regulator [Pseudomonadaceae bacterium]|nr:ArsR family transcriptional regulator [Pseudomonadaceae bacterium]
MSVRSAVSAGKSALNTMGLDSSIRAVAHPVRRNILEWLKSPQLNFPDQEYGQELGVCLGQIIERCELSPSTVSKHVGLLRSSGLLEFQKVGNAIFVRRSEASIQHFKMLMTAQISVN